MLSSNTDNAIGEAVVWNLRTGNSHSFSTGLSSRTRCDYCQDETNKTHGTCAVWLHGTTGVMTFIYVCVPRVADNIYVRLRQTDLKGGIICDEHLQFKYKRECLVADSEPHYASCNFDSIDESSIVRVTIAYTPRLFQTNPRLKCLTSRDIVFDLHALLSTPLRPEQMEFWFNVHDGREGASRKFRYEGLALGSGSQYDDVAADLDGNMGAQGRGLVCHCYSDPYFERTGTVSGDDITSNRIRAAIDTRRRASTLSVHCRDEIHSSASIGPVSYHVIGVGPSTTILNEVSIDVFANTRWTMGSATKVCGPLHVNMKSQEGDVLVRKWAKTRCTVMNESFVIIHLLIVEDEEEEPATSESVIVLLAFDPDYEAPRVDGIQSVFTDRSSTEDLWQPFEDNDHI
jgi:hypothetical protein